MPTYEYQCQKCGHTFEQFQSIKAEPLQKCVQKGCRGKVRRLIGAGAGLLFKGSGFYITDYRSEGYKKAAKAGDSAGSSSGESKSSGESNSSPAPASPAAVN
jgi:putative FmdB family regulatory protein